MLILDATKKSSPFRFFRYSWEGHDSKQSAHGFTYFFRQRRKSNLRKYDFFSSSTFLHPSETWKSHNPIAFSLATGVSEEILLWFSVSDSIFPWHSTFLIIFSVNIYVFNPFCYSGIHRRFVTSDQNRIFPDLCTTSLEKVIILHAKKS